jgi:spectinomycin phosphotransferase
MLEKPALTDEKIITCLQEEYGLQITRLAFLPLGADQNTAVYRAVASDETPYFVKLRLNDFDEIAVMLPKYYRDQGIRQIIAPLAAQSGQLWAGLEAYKLILYPYVEGKNVYEIPLSDRQWVDFGKALKRIHSVSLPPALARRIPRETYSPRWRDSVRMFLGRLEEGTYDDPVAVKVAAFLQAKREEIGDLVARAERLAQVLQVRLLQPQPPEIIVCHSDIHAGNILVAAQGEFYIVDWDNPIWAPKERDLMYAGGGQFSNWRTPQEEEDLFYQGYGRAQVDPAALAYYRYERIVTDIAIYSEQLLGTDEGGEDREPSLKYLMSNFEPGGTIEIALRAACGFRGTLRPSC